MKEFIEKLIGRLEEAMERYEDVSFFEMNTNGHTLDFEYSNGKKDGVNESIEIVNQLAEEYKRERKKVISELLKGEWVDTDDVKKYLGIEFSEGMHIFDLSRTAEWNPPPLNGQKITTKFRLKRYK